MQNDEDGDNYDASEDASDPGARTGFKGMPVGTIRAELDAQLEADPEIEAANLMDQYPTDEQQSELCSAQSLEHPEERASRLNSGLTKAQAAFLVAFRLIPSQPLACRKACVSISAVEDWRKKPLFRQAYADAYEAACGALFSSIYVSAVEGDVEAVYQGGIRVGFKRKFSDRCRELLAKAMMPSLFDRKALAGPSVNINIKATQAQIAEAVRKYSPTARKADIEVAASVEPQKVATNCQPNTPTEENNGLLNR